MNSLHFQRMELDALIALRHALHRAPEVSGAERETAATIAAFLRALHPDALLTGIGGHGVLATFNGRAPGRTALFRCELDALPIQEVNAFAHRSARDGVSHKCGHDGHMAILCGLASQLSANRPSRGVVHLLFQPAEENGSGAHAVLADPRFAALTPDVGFALHNMPGFPMGEVVVRDGLVTAAVRGMALSFAGSTSHASQPELGRNPALAIADLLRDCAALNRPNPERDDFQLITPVHFGAGQPGAFGVTAGDGALHLTIRAWRTEGVDALQAQIESLAREYCIRDGLTLSTRTSDDFHANVNDPAATALVREAARLCGLTVNELQDPVKGGEDFGAFTVRFPCSIFLIGAGETCPPVHSPDYDFPDALIAPGLSVFSHLVAIL
jgi:amidohydrolase